MSPLPIIQRQRALSRVGEIRTGGEKPASGKGAGKKLETFRLTSQHRDIIDRCAALYGGTVSEWESPAGPAFQLYTETASLPTLLIVGYSLRLNYEKWDGATKCTRRCDGEEEQVSGSACICNATEKDECDIVTRLMVVLPETGTSLGWQLRSIGENASRELSGAMMMAEEMARGRAFVTSTLRLTQRRGVKDGQVVRYVVPVLDFNLAEFAGQISQTAEGVEPLPRGFTPVAAFGGVTLEDGLAAVSREAEPRVGNGRQAAAIGPAPDDIVQTAPIPVGDEGIDFGAMAAQPDPTVDAVDRSKLTKAQATKLNVLVGQLRDGGHLTTEQLWKAGGLDPEQGRGEDGEIHWSPLRDGLSRDQASALIERLTALEEKVAQAAPVQA